MHYGVCTDATKIWPCTKDVYITVIAFTEKFTKSIDISWPFMNHDATGWTVINEWKTRGTSKHRKALRPLSYFVPRCAVSTRGRRRAKICTHSLNVPRCCADRTSELAYSPSGGRTGYRNWITGPLTKHQTSPSLSGTAGNLQRFALPNALTMLLNSDGCDFKRDDFSWVGWKPL